MGQKRGHNHILTCLFQVVICIQITFSNVNLQRYFAPLCSQSNRPCIFGQEEYLKSYDNYLCFSSGKKRNIKCPKMPMRPTIGC